jgi:hypothetical protein
MKTGKKIQNLYLLQLNDSTYNKQIARRRFRETGEQLLFLVDELAISQKMSFAFVIVDLGHATFGNSAKCEFSCGTSVIMVEIPNSIEGKALFRDDYWSKVPRFVRSE